MKFVTLNAQHDLSSLPGEVIDYGKDRTLTHVPGYEATKAKLARYHAPSWQFDVVPAVDRLFAMLDAAESGITVWVDPRLKVIERPTELDFRIPGSVGLFKRDGMPAKTDLVIFNGDRAEHQEFKLYVLGILDRLEFQSLTNWTDGAILEGALKAMELEVTDLSMGNGKEKDPLKATVFGKFFDF
jgi:hypothetical protein